jgi:hypothetical protein
VAFIHHLYLSASCLSFNTLAHPFVLDSEILHVELPGASMIILNTHDAAIELLERRSRLYSSRWASLVSPCQYINYLLLYFVRPRLPMLELSKGTFNFGLLPYGKDFLRQAIRPYHSLTSYYDKATNGGRAADPFIRIFGRARRRSTTTIFSMDEINFFQIC